ncbi:MAG: amidohydrolase family protein [Pseudomonadota bacterium]
MSVEKGGVIDVWAQAPTERMAAAPWMASLRRWIGQTGAPHATSVEETLAAMDAAGVEIALLAAWSAPGGHLISNEELEAQIDAAPSRFRGLISPDLAQPMEGVRAIKARAGDPRFVGVRITPWVWDLPPNDRRYYPIYAACVEAGLPFCTQIGHTGPLMRSETGRPIPYLEDVLLEFPELVVVGGHVGFPWIAELTSLMAKFPNLHLDTSAYALSRLPPDFVALMKGVGRGRVMFGTNWPMLAPERCLAGLDALALTEADRESFLSGAARRVFKLG